MEMIRKLPLEQGNQVEAVRRLLRSLLNLEEVDAVLVPLKTAPGRTIFPGLVSDADRIDTVDPISPCFPMNAAQLLGKLTRKPTGAFLVACLRPCEIRAAIERAKLHQGSLDEVILVGMDCLGALSNRDFRTFSHLASNDPAAMVEQAVRTGEYRFSEGLSLTPACQSCTAFTPDAADIAVCILGSDGDFIPIEARTEKGRKFLDRIGLEAVGADVLAVREDIVSRVRERRAAFRDALFETTQAAVDSPEKLAAYFADCVLCTNCRVACPICYCRECVFLTDVFDNEPLQYRTWSRKHGAVRLPRDVVFFHLTRLVHMSTGCVGCGQCSNACPNDIAVMDLFTTIASGTQRAFGYVPGRSLDEPPPMTVFEADELAEVVG
ncbi:MAG: Coenzyme F420 hydrogenase/dehydrogenase, beta subunit C-terminal domain [Thermodesulfobacteriota bacterium]